METTESNTTKSIDTTLSKSIEDDVGLSTDIIQYLTYSYLPLNDIISMTCCSRKLQAVLDSNSCWFELIKRDFNDDDIPDDFKQILAREMDQEIDLEVQGSQNFPSSFPQMKIVYCLLRNQWQLEASDEEDFQFDNHWLSIERVGSAARNPACLCRQSFAIHDQKSSTERTFGFRSYCEFEVLESAYWMSVGAAETSIPRSGDYVLGNNSDRIAIGYYGADQAPTFNLNHKILSNTNVRSLQKGDIVGVHVYRVPDREYLLDNVASVKQYRENYFQSNVDTQDWKIFAAIYLNGEVLCELPLMSDKHIAKLFPAVALGKGAKLRVLSSLRPVVTKQQPVIV